MTDTSEGRFDFKFVDGLRGLAAVSVAILHSSLFTGYEGDMARDYPMIAKTLFLGNYAVAVFIVLSGFVLMLPIARTPDLKFKYGTWSYIKRRAKRILPPYFASMLLFCILILCVPVLQTDHGTAWDSKVPVTLDGVIAHLFVVHNFDATWAYQVNGPAWSIGTEWQLYFALPFVILPIWRRFGAAIALSVVIAISSCIGIFLPSLDSGHLWFLGLFTMGACVAYAVVRGWSPRYLGFAVTLAGLVAAVLVLGLGTPLWLNELAVGSAIALAIHWLATRRVRGTRTVIHRVLESKPLVWLGLWSFSLYLIHSPLLGLANLLLLDLDMSTMTRFLIQVVLVLPLAALVAYAFHVVVERRFITSHQRRTSVLAPPAPNAAPVREASARVLDPK